MIEGLRLIPRKKMIDNRGKTCKIYTKNEGDLDELFLSYSRKDVIRGIHFQEQPHAQKKVVTVIKGRIKDVVIDLREDSPSFLQVNDFDLGENSEISLLVPKGCGHGFLALDEENIVLYEIEGEYAKNFERGILWNSINYDWNIDNPILSERDMGFETLDYFLKGGQKDEYRL